MDRETQRRRNELTWAWLRQTSTQHRLLALTICKFGWRDIWVVSRGQLRRAGDDATNVVAFSRPKDLVASHVPNRVSRDVSRSLPRTHQSLARHVQSCAVLEVSTHAPRPKVILQLQHQGQNGRAVYLKRPPILARTMLAIYYETYMLNKALHMP